MVNIYKVSSQILHDGLYNTLLFEIKEQLGVQEITEDEICSYLQQHSEAVGEYKEINRQTELSNIQTKELLVGMDDSLESKNLKNSINKNMQILRNLEHFEEDATHSAYAIWISSFGFMLIFMIHNLFALFSELYTTAPLLVYGTYVVMSYFTYIWYVKMRDNHNKQHALFQTVYTQTKAMIADGFKSGCFTYDELYIL